MKSVDPLQHIHQRKRENRRSTDNLQPFPHPLISFRLIDQVTLVIGILSPIMTIPQLYTIFVYQNATGVSIISWSAYTIFSCVWFVYGVKHKEIAIMTSQALWIVMSFIVVVGVFIYG